MPRQTIKEMKERFLADTENHTMEVLRDDGLYRHLKFTNNGSQVYRFDIHTWPGYLCICQDMGTYVFSRIPDMFDFFGDNFDGKHPINQGYWGEKLQAMNGHHENSYMAFDQELFEEHVKDEYDAWIENNEIETDSIYANALWNALKEEVISASYDGEVRGYDAAMSFRFEDDDWRLADNEADYGTFAMEDFWDHNSRDYTFHYTWILFAIVWGIREYNRSKEQEAA